MIPHADFMDVLLHGHFLLDLPVFISFPASFRPLALFLSRLFELDRSAFFDASVLEKDTNDRLWFRCMGGVGFGFGVCGPWVACSINHYLVMFFFLSPAGVTVPTCDGWMMSGYR